MTQPPSGDPNRPQWPPADEPDPPPAGEPYAYPHAYPPPVDPFATSPPPSSPPPWDPPPWKPLPPWNPPPSWSPPPGSPGSAGEPPTGSPAGPAPGDPPTEPSSPYASPGYPYPPTQPPEAGYPPPTYPAQAGLPPAVPGYDAGVGYPPPPAPKRRRGLLITAIVLGVALLLCGGGGTAAYLFLRSADGQGAQSPQVAVNDFLVAIYTEQDPAKAERLVCSEARDRDQLTKKIDEVRSYADKYKQPRFSWPEPTVAESRDDTAKVTVEVRITTEDEKVAEQQLSFTLVRKTGWFVCEVQSG